VLAAVKYQGKLYSYSAAKQAHICSKSTVRGVMGFKFGKVSKLKLVYKDNLGLAYVSSAPEVKAIDSSVLAKLDSQCVPIGARHHLGIPTTRAKAQAHSHIHTAGESCGSASSNDKDTDGIPDIVDADNNDDGIVDNDDTACNDMEQAGSDANSTAFWMFSDFQMGFVDAINVSPPNFTLTKDLIDSRLVDHNHLALEIIGGGSQTVELDCNGLGYCSAGGTGAVLTHPSPGTEVEVPFPGDPGGTYDSDGDGQGILQADQAARDFSFVTNANSSQVQVGDVLTENVVQSDGSVKSYSGMLNYVFWTTPALKSVAVQGGRTYTVTYPVQSGDPGDDGNCFHVPTTGDVILTVTAWRPQRAGVEAAGESQYVDMGNLRIQTTIPNAPVGSGQMRGPGTCTANATVYPSFDTNFTFATDVSGLQDHSGDVASSTDNIFTFTVNISACLQGQNNFQNITTTWSAGQTLKIPLQMTNLYGDTAAQNFCLIRDDS